MKKTNCIIGSLIATLALVGCGGGGGSSNGSPSQEENQPSSNNPVSLKTQKEAQKSIYALQKIIVNGNLFKATNQRNRSLRNVKNREIQRQNCPYGGILVYDGSNSGNGTYTFDNCSVVSGLTTSGTIKSSNIVMDEYNNLKSGILNYYNFYMATSDIKINANNLNANVNKETEKYTVTYNGNIALTTSSNERYNYTHENYALVLDNGNFMTINGTTKITSSPQNCNLNGLYRIETIESLGLSGFLQYISSGKLKINDAIYTYNSDKTVTIEAGGESKTIKQGLSACD